MSSLLQRGDGAIRDFVLLRPIVGGRGGLKFHPGSRRLSILRANFQSYRLVRPLARSIPVEAVGLTREAVK